MKNILLGVLLVALAAVVVNKKMWKHRTFLLIVVGILVAMMAVSMFAGKEMFQTSPSTSGAAVCSSDSIIYMGTTSVSFNGIMTNTTLSDSTRGNTVVDTNILFPRARFVNVLANNSCWDRLRQYLIWHMTCDTLIYRNLQKANSYTGNLNLNTEDRYMNFVWLLNEDSFLRGNNYATSALSKIASPRGTGDDGLHRLASLLQHAFGFYALRANTPVSDVNNEKLYFIATWLSKATMWNIWPVSQTGRAGLIRRSAGLALRYLNYQNGNLIAFSVRDSLSNLLAILFEEPWMNGKYGIRASSTPATGDWIINGTVDDFYLLLFGCYMIKLFAIDLNIMDGRTVRTADGSTSSITTSRTVKSVFDTELKGIMERTLKNVACHEYIAEAAQAKGLTVSELDILLRNYMGDETKCLLPLSTDAIVAVINSVNKTAGTPYSTTTLSNNFIPQLYPSNAATFTRLGIEVRRILFKSLMDATNTTTTPYPSYDKILIGSENTGFIQMFNHIFNDADLSDSLSTNFFNNDFKPAITTSSSWNGYGYKLLEIPVKTFTGYINTVRASFATVETSVNPTRALPVPEGFTPVLHYDASDTRSYPGYGSVINNMGSAGTVSGTLGSSVTVSNGILNFTGEIVGTTTPSKITFPFYNFGDVFTVLAWINPTSQPGTYMGILTNKHSNSSTSAASNPGFSFSVVAGNKLNSMLASNNDTQILNPSMDTTQYGSWYHVAFILNRSSGILEVFKNGVKQGTNITITATIKDLIPVGAPFFIGGFLNASFPFTGQMGSIKVFNYAITPTQIQSEYNAGVSKYASAPSSGMAPAPI